MSVLNPKSQVVPQTGDELHPDDRATAFAGNKILLKISPLLDKNTKKLTKSFADNVLGRAHGSFDFCAQQGIYAPADESVAAALAGREFHSVLIALRDVAFAFPLGQTEQLGNFLLLDAKRKVERRDAVSVSAATVGARAALVGSLAFHVVYARHSADGLLVRLFDWAISGFLQSIGGRATNSVIGS